MMGFEGVCTQGVDYHEDVRQVSIITTRENGAGEAPPAWWNNKTKQTSTVEVFDLNTPSEWLQDALLNLAAIEHLPLEWDSTDADPPNQTAIQNSQLVLTALVDVAVEPSLIEPSTDDGICIGFWSGTRYAHIECFNDGEILAMIHDRGNSEPVIWETQPSTLTKTVHRIRSFLK